MSVHNTVPILEIRRRLGRREWQIPREFGPSGWLIDSVSGQGRIIISDGPVGDSTETWRHASMSWREWIPTYADLVFLHKAVWPDGWAYQVFAPPEAHINIHPNALHLWGKPDGSKVLPNFGAHGSI